MKDVNSLIFKLALFAICCTVYSVDLDPKGVNTCQKTVMRTFHYYQHVNYQATEYYRTCCTWFLICFDYCTRSRTVVRTRIDTLTRQSPVNITTCCNGFAKVGSSCPKPICSNGCLHGQCVAPNQCDCSTGWTGQNCTQDINECKINNGGCEQDCKNLNGTFVCSCRRGYTRPEENESQCDDVNECSLINDVCMCAEANKNPKCNTTCTNTPGSHLCSCSPGYEAIDNRYCSDVDECQRNTSACSHYCKNIRGSYSCSCPVGYKLDTDNKTCIDISECLTANGGCEHQCNNTIGSFLCKCNSGFTLDSNGLTCSDKNECETTQHGCEYCENLRGSYTCACPKGYQLNADNKTCSDLDECKEDRSSGIAVTLSGCSQNCNNTDGSFHCYCNGGFKLSTDGRTCDDINECEMGVATCDQICINVIGSYICKCREGYDIGLDINSCVGLPCQDLPPLVNGNASCVKGRTDDKCLFQCDQGFQLEGSSERWCQSNRKWNGTQTKCQRKACASWEPPLNAKAILPCNNLYETKCDLTCSSGYFLNGSNTKECTVSHNGLMEWTNENAACLESTICSPNPCNHSGVCSPQANGFVCNCENTGYKGATCQIGILQVPQIPILTKGVLRSGLLLQAKPDDELTVEIQSSSANVTVRPSIITFNVTKSLVELTLLGNSTGFFSLKFRLSGVDAASFEAPEDAVVYVNEYVASNDQDALGPDGKLIQGCFVGNQIESGTSYSNFEWNRDGSSNGIIQFAGNDSEIVPLSLSGGSLNSAQFQPFELNSVLKKPESTAPPVANTQACSSARKPLKYLGKLLRTNAFSYQVESLFNKHAPHWIRLAFPLKVSELNSNDLSGSLFNGSELVKKRSECTKGMLLNARQLYYVYETKQPINLYFPSKDLEIPTILTKCFVKNTETNNINFALISSQTNSSALQEFSSTVIDLLQFSGKIDRLGFTKTDSKSDLMFTYGTRQFDVGSGHTALNMTINGLFYWTSKNVENIFTPSEIQIFQSSNGKVDVNLSWMAINHSQSIRVKGNTNDLKIDYQNMLTCRRANMMLTTKAPYISLSKDIDNIISFTKGRLIRVNTLHVEKSQNASIPQGNIEGLKNNFNSNLTQLNATITFIKSLDASDKLVNESINNLLPVLYKILDRTNSFSLKVDSLDVNTVSQEVAHIRSLYRESLKRYQVLNERHADVDIFDIDGVESNFNEFTSFVALKESTTLKVERNSTASQLKWFTLQGEGRICLKSFCFFNMAITIKYGSLADQCVSNDDRNNDSLTRINAIPLSRSSIGGFLLIPTDSAITMPLSNTANADFTSVVTLFNQTKEVNVSVSNSKLSFSTKLVFLRNDTVTLHAKSSLENILPSDSLTFNFKGEFQESSNLAIDVMKKVDVLMRRIAERDNLRAVFIKSYQKRVEMVAKTEYLKHMENVQKLSSLQKQLIELEANLTISNRDYTSKREQFENAVNKSQMNPEQQALDSRISQECQPRLCLTACVPGIRLELCQTKLFAMKMTQNCSLVLKKENIIDIVEKTTQKSYTVYESISQCHTECPPLTKFFRKIFGKRKRRSLINVIAVPVLTKTFEKLGGSEAAIGSLIGGTLLGPIGSVLGGFVGSIFGSCDRVCRAELITKEVKYQKTDFKQVTKKVDNFESECETKPIPVDVGFNSSKSCLKSSSCSNVTVDSQCIAAKQQCFDLRKKLASLISNTSYLQYYDEFAEASAYNQLLRKMHDLLKTRISNVKEAVRISDTSSLIANRTNQEAMLSMQQFNKSTANSKVLTDAYEKDKGIMQLINVTIDFSYVTGMKFPNRILFQLTYADHNLAPTTINALLDIRDYDREVENVATMIVQRAIDNIKTTRRRRRSLATSPQSFLLENCFKLEKATLFLLELMKSLDDEVKSYGLKYQEYQRKQNGVRNYATSYGEALSDQVKNSSNPNINFIVVQLTNGIQSIAEESSEFMQWNRTLQSFFTNYEQTLKSLNLDNCVNFYDCLDQQIDFLNSNLPHQNNDVAKKIKDLLPFWNSTLQTLFHDLPNFETSVDLVTKLYASFNQLNQRDPYCGTVPFIEEDLISERYVFEGDNVELRIKIFKQSAHETIVTWKRGKRVIPDQYGNVLKLKATENTTGYYTCTVENKFGKSYCGTVLVKLYTVPKLSKQPKDINTFVGATSINHLECNATSTPEPQITWYFSSFTANSNDIPQQLSHQGKFLEVKTDGFFRSGYYYCMAFHSVARSKATVSRKARVNVLPVTTAVERVKLTFQLTTNATTSRKRRSTTNNNTILADDLSTEEKNGILSSLAKKLNVSISFLHNLQYVRTTDNEADISLELHGKNFTHNLGQSTTSDSWSDVSSLIIEDRQNLFLRPLLLYYEANKTQIRFNINGTDVFLNPETIGNDPLPVRCLLGQAVLENGFICGDCPAGSRFNGATSKCVECEKDSFQANSGRSSCLSCPNGTKTMATAAASVSDCIKLETTKIPATTTTISSLSPTTKTIPRAEDDEDNKLTIIIIVIVVIVILLIAGIVTLMACKRKRRVQKDASIRQARENPIFDDDGDSEMPDEVNTVPENPYSTIANTKPNTSPTDNVIENEDSETIAEDKPPVKLKQEKANKRPPAAVPNPYEVETYPDGKSPFAFTNDMYTDSNASSLRSNSHAYDNLDFTGKISRQNTQTSHYEESFMPFQFKPKNDLDSTEKSDYDHLENNV